MNHLLRGHAPITDDAWKEIDREAREHLVTALGARKLVDFDGPKGWKYSATNLGRAEEVSPGPCDGTFTRQRQILPLVELRTPFSIARDELEKFDRGAIDPDFDSLNQAASQTALAENKTVFHGLKAAGIEGIAESSSHKPIPLGANNFSSYPEHVAKAIETLLTAGVEGPYCLALSPESYTGIVESNEKGGYPLLKHMRNILGEGTLVWAPGLEGAVVASLRGGDFLFESGQDLSVGYSDHDASVVNLYIEESFSFRVATPEAAVALTI